MQENYLKELKNEFESLKSIMASKENKYKNTIMMLLDELKNTKEGTKNSKNLINEKNENNSEFSGDDNDSSFQSDEINFKKSAIEKENPPSSVKDKIKKHINSNDTCGTPTNKSDNIKQKDEDSILNELIAFKNEDNFLYRTEIPMKYRTDKLKLLKEDVKNDGKITRYFENNVIEVITKNGNLTKVITF